MTRKFIVCRPALPTLACQYANFSPDWSEQWRREFESVLDGVR